MIHQITDGGISHEQNNSLVLSFTYRWTRNCYVHYLLSNRNIHIHKI